MRRIIVSTALALAALTGAACHGPAPSARPAAPCQEDQPCWDCHTMGNHVCGPVDDLSTPTFSETLAETLPGPFPGWGGVR